jgi:UDP-N-acetylmuramyl pentapeptide synthase
LKSAYGGGTSRLLLVLGDMAELGDQAEVLHKELGVLLKNLNLQVTYYVGKFGQYVNAAAVEDSVEAVAAKLQKDVQEKNNGMPIVIYAKASNSKMLYKLPELLKSEANL